MLPDKKSEIVVHLPTDTDDTTVNDDATKVNSTGDSVEDEIEDVRAAFLDTPRSSNKTMVGEISSGFRAATDAIGHVGGSIVDGLTTIANIFATQQVEEEELTEEEKQRRKISAQIFKWFKTSNEEKLREFGKDPGGGGWNYNMWIAGRKSAVTPLSLLCRPHLSDVLKDMPHVKRLELIKFVVLHRGADPMAETTKGFARALTDTVYQGDVDIMRALIELKEENPDSRGLTREQLCDYRYHGSTLLHMACYDCRMGMIKFLVEEVGIDFTIEDDNGQSALFWCFARGPIQLECVLYLWKLGACATRIVEVPYKDKDGNVIKTVKLSPLSLAIGSCPEFAKVFLQSRTEIISNIGLLHRMRIDWKGVMVSRTMAPPEKSNWEKCCCFRKNSIRPITRGRSNCRTKFQYKTPRFAMQIQAKTMAWETLNYDDSELSYLELMLKYNRKELLQTKIIKMSVDEMWKRHSRRAFYVQFGVFVLSWIMGAVGTGTWSYRLDEDDFVAPFEAPDHSQTLFSLCLTCTFFLMFVEYREATTNISEYLSSIWNWADIMLSIIVITIWALMIAINGQTDYLVYQRMDRAIRAASMFFHLLSILKCLQAVSVHKTTGPLVAMLREILKSFVQFFRIWIIIYIGYTQALWAVWSNCLSFVPWKTEVMKEGIDLSPFSWSEPFFRLWLWLLGDAMADEIYIVRGLAFDEEVWFTKFLYYSWCVTNTIIMLNMLIAMMTYSFQSVAEDIENVSNLKYVERVQDLWLSASEDTKRGLSVHMYNTDSIDIFEGNVGLAQESKEKSFSIKDLFDMYTDKIVAELRKDPTERHDELVRLANIRDKHIETTGRPTLCVTILRVQNAKNHYIIVESRNGMKVVVDFQIEATIANTGWLSEDLYLPSVDNINIRLQEIGSKSKLGSGSVAIQLTDLIAEDGIFLGWLNLQARHGPVRLMVEVNFNPPKADSGSGGEITKANTWFHRKE